MNRPNRKSWNVDDLVIHARDAKERRMLRVVIAVLPDGRIRTVFAHRPDLPEAWRRRVFVDRPADLHDPRRYRISMSRMAAQGARA